MKTKKTFCLGLLVLSALLLAPLARADLFSYKTVNFTNSAASSTNGPLAGVTSFILTNAVTLTVNSDPIPIAAKRGIGLWISVVNTNAASSGITNNYDLGTVVNGVTNWTTTHPLAVGVVANGTTAAVNYYNVPDTIANNATLIRWAQCINSGPTNVTVSGWASWSTYAP